MQEHPNRHLFRLAATSVWLVHSLKPEGQRSAQMASEHPFPVTVRRLLNSLPVTDLQAGGEGVFKRQLY